ncbi:FKBP-type peptidyl-prolyl cis-trans isomerase [Nesterenkonia populi]
MFTSDLPLKPLALSASALLMLSACGNAEDDGLGDSDALSGVDVTHQNEGAPEVLIHEDIELEENASRVLNAGDGEQVSEDSLLEYHLVAVDPVEGDVLQDSYDQELTPYLPLPAFLGAEGQNQFIGEALSDEGVTVGSDVAVYLRSGDEEAAPDQEDALYVFHIEDQSPAHADGEEVEQSGGLPEIDSTIGEAPELAEQDLEDAPEELSTEVLIEGDGEEIGEEDYVFAQYRGWTWSEGEQFDSSWSDEGTPGEPFEFSMDEEVAAMTQQGAIEGWNEGIPGHRVGDRVLMVIPPELAYGEDGQGEDIGPDETLIFVVDLVKVIDAETVTDIMAQQQQQEQQAPQELELSEEEQEQLEELADEMGISTDELEMLAAQLGVESVDQLEEFLGDAEEAEGDADDPENDDADTEEGDE